MSKTLVKKLGISVLSDLTLFRPPMFPVGGTRRWKTKNVIFARLRHECNQTMLVFATVNLETAFEPYDLRLCPMVFHSSDYLLSKISV